jgi:formate hydrogenlyase subunit 6/NADH:ubiquinone oxidoreductase subunit I
MVYEGFARIVKPVIQGVKHLFMTPVTVKYPYERIENVTGENFRYDPKAGIAYPGYKGRHILYLDKCTGCSLCDIACQNIAEAIIMVYGFDLTISFDKAFYEAFKKGEPEAVRVVESILESVSKAHARYNSHPLIPVAWSDIRSIQGKGDRFEWRLNLEPIYEYRSEAIIEKYLGGFMAWVRSNGWNDELFEVEGADKEDEYHRLSNGVHSITVAVTKIDEKLPHNKKSYFPAVDYGRCVFCGFCVDACPFYALEMTPEYELSATDRASLLYSPKKLAKPPLTQPPAELGWIERIQMILRWR